MKTVLSAIAMVMLLATPNAFAQTWEGKNDDDGKRHGTWTHTDDNSGIKLEVLNYRHGELHGLATYTYPSGRKRYNTIFKDGVRHGATSSFYDNEKNSEWQKGTYTDERISGEWIELHSNGKAKLTENYFNGRLHGAASYSYASGGKQTTTAYRNGAHHGPYVSFFDNGDNSQQYEGQHTDGDRSGSWTTWHSNGQEKSILNYHAGKLHGPAEFFHLSGQRRQKTNFDLEKHHGPYSEYYDNADNSKKYVGTHRDNQRFGKWTNWDENGNMASEIIYRNGKKNGPASYYYDAFDDLTLKSTTVYQDDLHHGPYVKYGLNGVNKEEYGEHRNGKKVGEWVHGYAVYDLISSTRITKVSSITNWRDGEKHGMETKYIDYSEGLIQTTMPYKNEKREGVAEYYYNNADHTLRWKGNYVNDHRDGPWTQWFKNEKIEWKGSYESQSNRGQKIGTWREYNEDGELTKVSKFENGKLVSEQGNCNHDNMSCELDNN